MAMKDVVKSVGVAVCIGVCGEEKVGKAGKGQTNRQHK